jgi:hypothetical protein
MTTQARQATPRQIEQPVLRDDRLRCPRCDARLFYEGDAFTCIACGYEYAPSDRELRQYLPSTRRRTAPIVGGVAALLALGRPPAFGLGVLTVGGALALAAVAMLLLWVVAARVIALLAERRED